jgi:nitroimidazol reductase NimA-like FMN-containing flavoprotein (pyridoxamine 5'-phosphate oxidase superfamily)
MSVSSSARRRVIDRSLTVKLATISKQGTPLLTPLWFGRDGDVIYVGTRRGSLHARHIAENPRVVMLFVDGGGQGEERYLRVRGTARVCDIEAMSLRRKARLAWRYFFRPAAIAHWVWNWRKLGVRKRYYRERTDPSIVEIVLEDAELVTIGRSGA